MRSRVLIVAVGLLLASGASAQDLSPLQRTSRPMREAAQTHSQLGARFFESGQYDAPLIEFEAA